MWSPTHVQVTVNKAKNLLNKGRGGTNDAFVLIQMGKEKFQTSIKDRAVDPEWQEECDLTLLNKESRIILTVFHRNMLGLDEFLGQAILPLQEFESYDRPLNKWYSLKGKGDKKDDKYRGEIEICVTFVVRSCDTQSLHDFNFSKKRRRSSIKDIASSVGHKFQKLPSRSFSFRMDNLDPRARLERLRKKCSAPFSEQNISTKECYEGHKADDLAENPEDFNQFPMKRSSSLYSSTLSLPQSAMIINSIREVGSMEDLTQLSEKRSKAIPLMTVNSEDGAVKQLPRKISVCTTSPFNEVKSCNAGEWASRVSLHMKESSVTRSESCLLETPQNESPFGQEKKSKLDAIRNSLRRHTLQFADSPDLSSLKICGSPKKCRGDTPKINSVKDYTSLLPEGIPKELVQEYSRMNHQDLVILAIKQQMDLEKQRDKIADLETYLDNLLVRVMETTPRILQTPYKIPNPACYR